MKIIKKEWQSRTTGLLNRIRRAIRNKQESIYLTTAADVYGYWNLRPHLDKMGLLTSAHRRGKNVILYVNKRPPEIDPPADFPELRQALMDIKSGDQCVLLTTPAEAQYFRNVRPYFKQAFNLRFCAARNCTSVMVWKK